MLLRVLLVDARCGGSSRLPDVLAKSGFQLVGSIMESDDVIQAVNLLSPDAIIIDSESPRRDTLEGLAVLSQKFPRPIVMLSEQGADGLTRRAAQLGVSAYVVDGVSPSVIRSLIEVSVLHFHGQNQLHAELSRTQQVLEDDRVIHRAKCLLMERRALGEEDSYRLLRRMAMDRSQRLADLARALLAAEAI